MEKTGMKETKRLSLILAGKMEKPSAFAKKIMQITGTGEDSKFLFFYVLWTFVENKTVTTLTEDLVKNKLSQYPAIIIYYCRLQDSPDNPPPILKSRKMTKQIISGFAELVELIFTKTGASVTEGDLKPTQTDNRSLGIRAKEFMQGIKARESRSNRAAGTMKGLKAIYLK
jgi:hypothetical protein